MRSLLFIVFLCLVNLVGQSQNKLVCDSLLTKDYDFWYSNADAIFEGEVIKIKQKKTHANYIIVPTRAFAGISEQFVLKQVKVAQQFNFQRDTPYVFLVFRKYSDPVFSPCVIFGKASKMDAVVERYENYCGVEPMKENCICNPVYDPVCGCDGYHYKNPCEAACDGIYDFFRGPCYNTTPIRIKE